MESDIFKEVSSNEIPNYLEIFRKNMRKYFPLCQYVSIMEEYNKGGIEMPRQTLYKYGDIENGAYLFESYYMLGDIEHRIFHAFTASNDNSCLEKALSETGRVPWFTRGYVFQATLKRYAPVIRKVAIEKGIELSWGEGDMLWLPPEEQLVVSTVPDDMDLRFLTENNVTLLDEQWPYKFPGSKTYLGYQLVNNFGFGLFRKSDNKLACSAVTYNNGGIFVLYTDPEFRGKGYAEIIVRHLSNELRKRGRIPFATVHEENIPSEKIFRKVGYKDFSRAQFLAAPNHYEDLSNKMCKTQ